MTYLRSLLFTVLMIASLLVYAPLTLLTYPLAFRQRYAVARHWAQFVLWWLKRICGLQHTVEGLEHIPQGTAIVFSKHQSAWETMALQEIFPPQTWILKRELLWIPLFGWALALLEPIAIDRTAGRKALHQIIDQGRRLLDDGRWVIVFPEGTRVAPGERRRYGVGGAMLAERTGYPVVPVAHNAGEFWPRRSFLKHPGTIRLVIGPPIETKGRSTAQINAAAEAWIEGTMARISTVQSSAADGPPAVQSDP
jgi:1-acyl-sn-glycerol-3-phosphate acyltransferase